MSIKTAVSFCGLISRRTEHGSGHEKPDEMNSTANADPFKSRVILLGASNLSLGISSVVRSILQTVPAPVEFFIADGFGRSYGQTSRVMSRTLPGILDCDLWDDVAESHWAGPLPTFALITDIGNDIAYGVAPAQIFEWIKECVHRLTGWNSKIVMTGLPIGSLNRLSPTHFAIVRRILFPSLRMTVEAVQSRAEVIDHSLRKLANDVGFPVVDAAPSWYGLDPIHLGRRYWFEYWSRVLANWINSDEEGTSASTINKLRADPFLWCYLWTRWPNYRRFLGSPHRRTQPSGRLRDGSAISVY